jgi:hypothetical protein
MQVYRHLEVQNMSETMFTLLARHISRPYDRPSDTPPWLQVLRLELARLNKRDPRMAGLLDTEGALLTLLSNNARPPRPAGLSTF